jgi:hypothetical protein
VKWAAHSSASDGPQLAHRPRRSIPRGLLSAIVIALTAALLVGERAELEREAFAILQAAVDHGDRPPPSMREGRPPVDDRRTDHRPRARRGHKKLRDPRAVVRIVEHGWLLPPDERDALLETWAQHSARDDLSGRFRKLSVGPCTRADKRPHPLDPAAMFRCSHACRSSAPLQDLCYLRCVELLRCGRSLAAPRDRAATLDRRRQP